MAIELKVPSPGESINEVQIARWIKADGDFVEKDEEIAEIDSDKATLGLVAEADGVLKILVGEGETVAVGSVVATIDTNAQGVPKKAPAPAADLRAAQGRGRPRPNADARGDGGGADSPRDSHGAAAGLSLSGGSRRVE